MPLKYRNLNKMILNSQTTLLDKVHRKNLKKQILNYQVQAPKRVKLS